jgi:hypothetical protein
MSTQSRRPQHPTCRHTGERRYPLWAVLCNPGVGAAFVAVDPGFRRDDEWEGFAL